MMIQVYEIKNSDSVKLEFTLSDFNDEKYKDLFL